jgi:flagellar biosynthesis GTPase FlhF
MTPKEKRDLIIGGLTAPWLLVALCIVVAVTESNNASKAKDKQAQAEQEKDAANRELAQMLEQKSRFEKSCKDMLAQAEQKSALAAAIMQNAESQKSVYARAFKKFGFTDTEIAELLRTDLTAASKESVIQAQAFKHLPSDARPNQNFVIKDALSSSSYKSSLKLMNGLTEDAYVKIVKDNHAVASFYVRSNSNFAFTGIPNGSYRLMYCVGFGWDETSHDFRRGRSATVFDDSLDYSTRTVDSATVRTTYYDELSLTLHKIKDGNAKTSEITPEEFDRY